MLASSAHDAQLWTHAINVAAAAFEKTYSPSGGGGKPADGEGDPLPLPPGLHPEVVLASQLLSAARAAAGARFRSIACMLTSSPSDVISLSALAAEASSRDLGTLLPPCEVVAALHPEGWQWEEGAGEGPAAITAVLPVAEDSPTYVSRIQPLVEELNAQEEVAGRLASVIGGGTAVPRLTVARAVRLQNQCLGAIFAASIQALPASAVVLGTAYLPVLSAAEARRIASYGLSRSDLPRLYACPEGAAKESLDIVASAVDTAAKRQLGDSSGTGSSSGGGGGGLDVASAHVTIGVVRLAFRAPQAPALPRGRSRRLLNIAPDYSTASSQLQHAMAQYGAADAIVATFAEFIVFFKAVEGQ